MTIEELQGLCGRLKAERAELGKLEAKLRACNLNGHQHEISVTVSNVGSVGVTTLSRETGYASRVMRGREMILLGVKKLLAALVEQQAAVVAEIEQQIADARVTP